MGGGVARSKKPPTQGMLDKLTKSTLFAIIKLEKMKAKNDNNKYYQNFFKNLSLFSMVERQNRWTKWGGDQ